MHPGSDRPPPPAPAPIAEAEQPYAASPSTSVGDHPDSPDVPDIPQPAKKKRRREAKNCTECKRRKIKCNREKPCDQCCQRGDPEGCKWSELKPADKPIGRSSYNALKEQLTTTQNVCRQLQERYRTKVEELRLLRAQVNAQGGLPNLYDQAERKSPLDPVKQFQAQAESSVAAERMDVDAGPSSQPYPAPAAEAPGNEPVPKALIQGFETLEGFPTFPDVVAGAGKASMPEIIDPRQVWTSIPAKWVCDALVEYYFTKVEWHICMFHRPTFDRAYEKFWTYQTPEERAAGVEPEWITLLWVILCLALTSMDPDSPTEPKICEDRESWRAMGLRYWNLARQALQINGWNFMSSQRIEVVQALVLFSYCNLALDHQGYKGQSVMTSWAIRIAINQGLHRLGSEPEGIMTKGIVSREILRRAWWNVVFLDWNISTQMSTTYFIHPDQCDTAKPLNLNWEDMVEGRPLRPKPSRERSSASMLLAKVALAGTVRELSDRLNSKKGIDQAYLMEHQKQLEAVGMEIPFCWGVQDDGLESKEPVVKWERIQFQLHWNNRRIRLHRRFMLDGYRDKTYHLHPSTKACIDAARSILIHFEEGRRSEWPGSFAWYNVMYCWMAGVILAMDAFYSPDDISRPRILLTQSARRDYIDYAILALQKVGDISDLAPRGSSVLRFLLREAEKRTSAAAQLSPTSSHSSSASLGFGPTTQWMSDSGMEQGFQFAQLPESAEHAMGLDTEDPMFWQRIQDVQPHLLLGLTEASDLSSRGQTAMSYLPWAPPLTPLQQPQYVVR